VEAQLSLNITALESNLQRCLDAGRVLLSMLPTNASRSSERHLLRRRRAAVTPARLTRASRVVLQASMADPQLPGALSQLARCPVTVPDGVAADADARAVLTFVASECKDVPGIPAEFVFGDVIATAGVELPEQTVCLPSSVSRERYMEVEACLVRTGSEGSEVKIQHKLRY